MTLLPQLAIKAGVTRGTDLSVVPYEGKYNFRSLVLAWRTNAARRNEFQLLQTICAAIACRTFDCQR